MGTRKIDKQLNYSHGPTQTKQQIDECIIRTQMNPGQTQTHKTHHGSNLGEATTFPLILYFVPIHEINTQMSFCPGTPK
jgi:hypothetical protein